MPTPSEIAKRLADRAPEVAHHLLPGGKREGHEWRAGDTSGEKGKSLGVRLTGDKAGMWCDFNTGESGDLLDLWREARRCDMRTALAEAKSYLGVTEPALKSPGEGRKQYQRPEKPKCATPKQDSPVMAYLKSRGLTESTIKAFKIAEDGRNIVFPYLRDGALIHWKTMGVDRPGGKKQIRTSADSEPSLFGWQAISEGDREVTITEGEIDAMTAFQSGRAALSVPFGGGSGGKQRWIEYEFENLQRFDTIFLCLDSDEPGQQATEEIVKRLGRERCRLVDLGCKDFNEAVNALYYSRDDIDDCYAKAKNFDPERLKSAARYITEVEAEFFDRNPELIGMELPWEFARDKIRFRPSEVSIWTGWSGHGKSQLLNYLAFHGVNRKGNEDKFVIASMEMPARRTLQRMVRQASGMSSPSRGYVRAILDHLDGKIWIYDQVGSARTGEMLEAFRYAARRYGVNHFIVDSLAKLGMAEDDYNGQKQAMEALTEFAHEMDVHVHLVAHPRKAEDESKPPGKLDVRGGAVLTDLADNVITVWRNKRKENTPGDQVSDDDPDVKMVISKQRLNGNEGVIKLWFNKGCYQYFSNSAHRPRCWVEYEGQREQAA
ncbi:bifunctional DNA primase/helicase [Pseudomonas typographi]|uniref:AAA family ATPase n=1 Tax=Pseudomonas typographi TaxID=2715964 RepID=A0ABR7Z769_9PSED|nr:bifunctional DNA primase/helicase [Pseudomonas typographi]MBD1601164.1 AAA family ATPase [Pseudomonas typographi]